MNCLLGNMRSNFAVNQNLWERERSTHTKLLTEFGQCCLRLRTCYRSFIINPRNFTNFQLTSDPKYTQEIIRNFSKTKIFLFSLLHSLFFSSLVLSYFVFLVWDEFPLLLHACIYRRGICELVVSWCNNQTYQPKNQREKNVFFTITNLHALIFDQQSPT